MLVAGSRTRILILVVIIIMLAGLVIGYYVSTLTPERKPVEFQEKPYEYYIIFDEADGKTLAYVATIAVGVGDEYYDEDGQWYEVVRVEENRAFARRISKPGK